MITVERAVRKLGFDPYLATREQTLAGLNENMLRRLEESEYFLFVDFTRPLPKKASVRNVRWGFPRSLYSHQELAVATYLRLDPLIFQEKRAFDAGDSSEGFLRFLQGNCTTFDNRATLSKIVTREINRRLKHKIWKRNWKRGVFLRLATPHTTEARDADLGGAETRYFHMEIVNGDWRKTAWHCAVHVTRVESLTTNKVWEPRPVELKFDSVRASDVLIPAGGQRKFAILRMPYDVSKLRRFVKPPHARSHALLDFNVFLSDYLGTYAEYLLGGPDTYEVTLRVSTDLFAEAYFRVRIHVGKSPQSSWVRVTQ
ncbi:MAG: hypothetical protein WA549_03115 [Thermoplasmata archaeon]